ncbi:hypothetical protein PsorP6_003038 [Peronosclerospora sorghi]|uniref:Uncharacterized protein n=1 Tax=Peronosclerospora sorghi TaxID=230839 RepID=A0ACC0VM43_9STRA|nr:hypothetical protein PsorP6_003038 [Peronosclerospora sorghi]
MALGQKRLVQARRNLLARTNVRDTIDTRHDCLFHDLARDITREKLRMFFPPCVIEQFQELDAARARRPFQTRLDLLHARHIEGSIVFHFGQYLGRDTHVHIVGPSSWDKIHLGATSAISTKRCIVLQAIAGSILVNWNVRHVLCRVRRLERALELKAHTQCQERIIRALPPRAIAFTQWIPRGRKDLVPMRFGKCHTLIERALVDTKDIGKMDFHPTQSMLPQGLPVTKDEQASRQVRAQVIEVRWDRVHTATKIQIIRKVELRFILKFLCHLKLVQRITAQRVELPPHQWSFPPTAGDNGNPEASKYMDGFLANSGLLGSGRGISVRVGKSPKFPPSSQI